MESFKVQMRLTKVHMDYSRVQMHSLKVQMQLVKVHMESFKVQMYLTKVQMDFNKVQVYPPGAEVENFSPLLFYPQKKQYLCRCGIVHTQR